MDISTSVLLPQATAAALEILVPPAFEPIFIFQASLTRLFWAMNAVAAFGGLVD